MLLVRSTCLLAFLAHQAAAGGVDVHTRQKGKSEKKDMPYDPNPHIIEATEAEIGEYPYFVHLQIAQGGTIRRCGGSLIAPQVILSAAGCNDPYFDSSTQMGYVGATRYWSPDNGAVFGVCDEWISHPEYIPSASYVPGTGPRGGNDFALCLLKKPVDIDMTSVMLKMNEDPSFPPDTTDTVTESMGMGTSAFDGNAYFTDVLLRADLNIMPQQNCTDTHATYDDVITDTMICTYDNMDDTRSGVCAGDYGGPIVVSSVEDGKTIHTQVGVVSWGSGFCGTLPDVHARVSEGMEWIKSTVCDDWGVTAEFCPPKCSNGESVFTVTITTDDTPEQNMWSLRDSSSGSVVISQSLEVANREYVDTVCLTPGTYEWELTDSEMDGMPDGSVEVSLNNEVLLEGFSSGSETVLVITAPDDLTDNPTSAPTMAPTDYYCETNQSLKVTVQSDYYYGETYWTLEQYVKEDDEWTEIAGSWVYTSQSLFVDRFCLDAGVYRFSIFDSYGDGLLFGGFFDVELNGNTIASGNDFGVEDITFFHTCVDNDSATFSVDTGQTGTCQDLATLTENRNWAGRKGCQKIEVEGGQNIFDLCPSTCAAFGYGVCAAPY